MRQLADLVSNPPKEQPYWIGGGLLPRGGIMIFGGETGIGKTMLMLNLARDLASPTPILWGIDRFPIPDVVPVLYVDQESGEYALYRRAKTMFGDKTPEGIWYSSNEPEMQIDSLMGRKKLERMIDEVGAKVVLLDPASNFIEGSENSNDDVKKLFLALYEIRSKRPDISFVLAHHYGKPPKGYEDKLSHNPFERYNFRGASKWVDSPDSVVTLVRGQKVDPGELWRIKASFQKVRHAEEPAGIYTLALDSQLNVSRVVPKGFARS